MSEYIFKANFKIDNCLTCPVSNIVINCPCFTGQAYATDFCNSKHPNCPLKELPPHGTQSDWHTGTPTEEGWYLCERKKYEYRKYFVYRFKNGKWDYFLPENILRWQKIE